MEESPPPGIEHSKVRLNFVLNIFSIPKMDNLNKYLESSTIPPCHPPSSRPLDARVLCSVRKHAQEGLITMFFVNFRHLNKTNRNMYGSGHDSSVGRALD